ncbi:MAG: hypothetical protein HPY58_08255 [Firmicutes bacterium]|nr:hypothetical protein [Bacillota bacterium]
MVNIRPGMPREYENRPQAAHAAPTLYRGRQKAAAERFDKLFGRQKILRLTESKKEKTPQNLASSDFQMVSYPGFEPGAP